MEEKKSFFRKNIYAIGGSIILILGIIIIIFIATRPASTTDSKSQTPVGSIGGLTETPKSNNSDSTDSRSRVSTENNINTGVATTGGYEFTTQKGDTLALLARKAILRFEKDVNMIYSNPQRMFVETNLIKNFNFKKIKIGEKVLFELSVIKDLYDKSQYLTEKQVRNWNFYAKKVNYNIL